MNTSSHKNFWKGKSVLLTGHTGFKGSWLSLWLTRLGANVHGVSLEPQEENQLFNKLNLKQTLYSHQVADIRSFNLLSRIASEVNPDIVFHLAAQPLVRKSYQDPLETWGVNVQGSLNLLEALKPTKKKCAVVMITTDKVYANKEWEYGYRESDELGGHDPYSASKAAAEIAISSWRASFCGSSAHQTSYLQIATARAGNVIGGGDWAADRIVPDAIRALAKSKPISVRNPLATRPWQHVLEPLSGYMSLAESLMVSSSSMCEAFNFGPLLESNRTVQELIETMLRHWPGKWINHSDPNAPHEAGLLHLQIDKSYSRLGWQPRWNYETTIEKTINWYRATHNGESALDKCLADLEAYETS